MNTLRSMKRDLVDTYMPDYELPPKKRRTTYNEKLMSFKLKHGFETIHDLSPISKIDAILCKYMDDNKQHTKIVHPTHKSCMMIKLFNNIPYVRGDDTIKIWSPFTIEFMKRRDYINVTEYLIDTWFRYISMFVDTPHLQGLVDDTIKELAIKKGNF